jgi:hypothetical protein
MSRRDNRPQLLPRSNAPLPCKGHEAWHQGCGGFKHPSFVHYPLGYCDVIKFFPFLAATTVPSFLQLFTWGRNKYGQVGNNDVGPVPTPTRLNGLSKEGVVHVACGEDHTLAITKNRELYTVSRSKNVMLFLIFFVVVPLNSQWM